MPDDDLIVSVAVPTPLRKTFQYRAKPDSQIEVGSRVQVSFSNRPLTGVVLSIGDEPEIAINRIKAVSEVHAEPGNLPPEIMRLCQWAAGYYEHPIGEVFAAALPGLLRKGWNPLATVEYLATTAAAPSPDEVSRAPAQRRALELLSSKPLSREELTLAEVTSQTIRTLLGKDWVEWQQRTPETGSEFVLKHVNLPALALTQEQESVIASAAHPGTTLLEGVTGSGKTEVYLRVIEPLLKAGKQVIVLVPEIGLTPQTISRFSERFDVPMAIMHSSLTDRERAENWYRAREGQVGIILGTRSAVFTPMKNPGAIIVDEEHDASYKQHDGFRYSARDLAVVRGNFEKLPVILGTATPSLESLHNTTNGKYRSLQLKQRVPGSLSETYEVIDTRHLEVTGGFTRGLRREIGEQLSAGNQVLVFLNRRGFAPVLMCGACNWIANCRRCDARMTYHQTLKTLICHHCGAMDHNVISCQSCGSNQVAAIGQGTQRVEQTLQEFFPQFPILRIDRDSTRRKGAMASYLETVGKGEPCILVGTQMLAKGHHFPDVTLVALLDIDAGFYSSDFRAVEKLGQLILQVGGRAGRAEKPGKVILQTEFAHHPLLRQLIENGYASFAAAVLEERRAMELPPYTFSSVIRAEAHQASAAREFLNKIVASKKVDPSVNVLGPVPALMEKRAGRFRQLLLLTSSDRGLLHQEIHRRIATAESLPEARKVRWSVDIDPVDMF